MKRIILLIGLAISANLFAQEAGKVGKLLDNEAKSEVSAKVKSNDQISKRGKGNQPYGNNRNTENNRGGNYHQDPRNYNWNYQYIGYSEVFLRIPENGIFTVTIGNQSITTTSGKFRFFDLLPGNQSLAVFENGMLLYRTRIVVQNNHRMILDFFTYEGLYLLDSFPLQNAAMSQFNYSDLWNQMWNGFYNGFNYNYGANWNPFYGLNNGNYNQNYNGNQYNNQNNNGYYNNSFGMNAAQFQQFKRAIDSQSYDDTRIEMIKQQARNARFNSQQVKELLECLSFDSGRLNLAKYLYDFCNDKQNYYQTYSVFSFDSSVRELAEYINKR